jgi:hypothetical protein
VLLLLVLLLLGEEEDDDEDEPPATGAEDADEEPAAATGGAPHGTSQGSAEIYAKILLSGTIKFFYFFPNNRFVSFQFGIDFLLFTFTTIDEIIISLGPNQVH